MSWHTLKHQYQVDHNEPRKAFEKAKKIYGKHVEDAPIKSKLNKPINTDFDELLRIRKKQSLKQYRNQHFNALIAFLGIIILIMVILSTLLGD